MNKQKWITIGFLLSVVFVMAVSCEKPQNDSGTPEVESDSIVIRDLTVICYGTVLSDGGDSIRERGICWYGEPYPTSISDHTPPVISDHRMVAGGDLGSFSRTLNHYGSDSIYYFRAYARNDVGVSYGSEMGFRCIFDPNLDNPDDEPGTPIPVLLEDLPTVTISPVTDITENHATCRGAIIDNGGSAIIDKGFCWRTDDNPDYEYICVTESDFAYTLNNLAPNTAYYVRAYAFNGKGTGYSNEISFTTLEEEEPSYPYIAVLYGDNYLGDGQTVELFKEYEFGFTMYSPAGLRSFLVQVNNNNGNDLYYSMDFHEGEDSYEYKTNIRFSDRYDRIIKCTVEDKDGNYKTVNFRVHINPETKTSDCEWIREGNNCNLLVIEGAEVYPPDYDGGLHSYYGFSPMVCKEGCSYCGHSITLYINGECTHHDVMLNTAYAYESEFVRDYYCDYTDYNGMTYLIHTEKIYGPTNFEYYTGFQCVISGKVTY
ncbi:MAG: fibronectin type III domain-containing protein [Bacteroidales bacterium]|nr:fibronectin type III domain-containing protein [Bacteroidales bacterium]